MKKLILSKIILILLTFFSQGQTISQFVIGAAGNIDTLFEYQVNWTVGETISEKFTDPECTLTQGFHQTYFTISGITTPSATDFSVVCYPNPTIKYVHVKVSAGKPMDRYMLVLYDMQGKSLYKAESGAEEIVTIDLSRYNASVLLLHVVKIGDKQGQVFKIIKQNH